MRLPQAGSLSLSLLHLHLLLLCSPNKLIGFRPNSNWQIARSALELPLLRKPSAAGSPRSFGTRSPSQPPPDPMKCSKYERSSKWQPLAGQQASSISLTSSLASAAVGFLLASKRALLTTANVSSLLRPIRPASQPPISSSRNQVMRGRLRRPRATAGDSLKVPIQLGQRERERS